MKNNMRIMIWTVPIITVIVSAALLSFDTSSETKRSIDKRIMTSEEGNRVYDHIEFSHLIDTLELDRAKYVALVMEMIKGREKMLTDSVFKNIKIAKGAPAERLLKMMDGFSKALGVSCGHCHNTAKFESDEKTQKDVARQMFAMNMKINKDLLGSVKGLQNLNPQINCTTCHRGQTKPALELPKK